MTVGDVIDVDEEYFMEIIEKPRVLVEFYASWCGPCRTLDTQIDQLSIENSELIVIKVNIERCPLITQKYSISSIPTIIYFEQSTEIRRHVGTIDYRRLKKFVISH